MSRSSSALSNTISNRGLSYLFPQTNAWVRNPSWLPLSITDSDQKFVGLFAIREDESNHLSLSATGNYTVNWGDGVTENYNSGVQSYHTYNFNDSDLDNTNGPVTFTDSGDLVTKNSHGYSNGISISFFSITTTTGISAGQIYYVINATTNTFQLAATKGGSAISLTNNGSGIILPYKQAVVVVTPQDGQTLTSVDIWKKHNKTGLPTRHIVPWLEIAYASSNFNSTGPVISGSSTSVNNFCLIEQIALIILGSKVDLSNFFHSLFGLEKVPLFNTASVTNVSGMFYNCYSLREVPLFNTASVVSSMSSMFYNCYSLKAVPLFNTSSVTNMSTMFYGCSGLREVPLFNTSSVTNMSSMFYNCYSLEKVPLFNTGIVQNLSSMFVGCYNLREVPLFNTVSATNMSSMFYNCYSLREVPLFNTGIVTNMSSMFIGCYNLQEAPLLNTASTTNFANMFNGCIRLRLVPAMDVSAAASSSSYANMFSGCTALRRIQMTGFKYTFSVASCNLSGYALNEIFTNLATVTSQTITVTGNHGVNDTVSGLVTFTDSGDLVTLNGHSFKNDQIVTFSAITNTTGINVTNSSTAYPYYVVNSTTNTFQVASTKGGSALALTTDGTGTVLGYDPNIAVAKGWTVTN